MLGVGVGNSWSHSAASSLLGGIYLPRLQMPPEFEEKDSQNVQIWMGFRALIPPETQTFVQWKLMSELGTEPEEQCQDSAQHRGGTQIFTPFFLPDFLASVLFMVTNLS